MAVITHTRRATEAELADEMDRRGAVIERLRERCEAYKAQVKDGADVIAGLRERLAEANDESEKCIKLIAEMVSRKQVYVAELFTGSGYRWCISDGYAFFLQKLKDDKEPMVKAGCRYFTLLEAQKHWEETRVGQTLLDETREIVRCMVNLAHVRGLLRA